MRCGAQCYPVPDSLLACAACSKSQALADARFLCVCGAAGCPRLFDLVKVREEALRPAFYYAMRDTVVASDLDQASRIAYGADKRWRRVVTVKVR